jgi:hypothetical protein
MELVCRYLSGKSVVKVWTKNLICVQRVVTFKDSRYGLAAERTNCGRKFFSFLRNSPAPNFPTLNLPELLVEKFGGRKISSNRTIRFRPGL